VWEIKTKPTKQTSCQALAFGQIEQGEEELRKLVLEGCDERQENGAQSTARTWNSLRRGVVVLGGFGCAATCRCSNSRLRGGSCAP
jgi:hypothetical protein